MNPPEPTPPEKLVPSPTSKPNGLAVCLVILTPPILTLILAAARRGESETAAFLVFVGSGVASVIAGYLAAAKYASSVAVRVLVALVLAVGLYFLSVALCFVGCAIGNNLR